MSSFLSRTTPTRGGRRGRGRRIQVSQRQKFSPYGLNQVSGGGIAKSRGADSMKWSHDLFNVMNDNDDFTSKRSSSIKTRGDVRHIQSGARVYVTNLHPDIRLESLVEIFEEAGEINKDRSNINYDQTTGQSLRTANIHYTTRSAADKAIQQFHNAEVDGKIIKVTYSQESNMKSIKCFECGGVGHLARECPSATRRERGGNINKMSSIIVTPTKRNISISRSSFPRSSRGGRPRGRGRNINTSSSSSFLKRTGGPISSGSSNMSKSIPTSEKLDSEMDDYWSSNT